VSNHGAKVTPEMRIAVEELLSEFASRVDEGRGDSVHELFIETGRIETPAFKLAGREEIQQRFSARARDKTRKTRHFWSNPKFSGDPSRILVTTNVLTVVNVEGQTSLMGGTSLDVVVPHADGWAFAERRLEIAFEGNLVPRGLQS
jgi:SnoaL-like domain